MVFQSFPDPRWSQSAACRGLDVNLFFPEKGVSARKAKKICAECPVVDECLDYALNVPEEHGVWGNTAPEERKAMRRSSRLLSG